MKIAAFFGSPRQGANSETLAEAFCQEAERLGATVERTRLAGLTGQGCVGCMACKTKREDCALQDDITPALAAAKSADVVVLAAPVYFGDVCSQAKRFIDRWYAFLTPTFQTGPDRSRLAAGKRMVLVVTQGADDDAFGDVPQRYGRVFSMFGLNPVYLIRGGGLRHVKAAMERPELLEKARATARKVTTGEPSDFVV